MPASARTRRRRKRRVGPERAVYRKQPRQARARATVDVILDAAQRVLVRTGYEKFTTNKVARLAGVSIGSLYQYFPSKRALVGALLDRHVERSTRALREDRRDLRQASVEQMVRRLTTWMVRSHQAEPELHRVIVRELPRQGLTPTIEMGFERAIASTRTFLESRSESLAPRNLELSAFIVVHTIESLTKAALARDPALLDAELIDEITRLLVSYLQPQRRVGP
jgi:AcrR family transcriptional regulator